MSRAVICSRMRAFSSLPPSMARTPGIFAARERASCSGVGIVAADDDVAVESFVSVQQFSRKVVKRRRHAHSLGHEFGGLLRGRALPDAERARGAAADSGGERDGGVDENAAGADRGLELLEQRGLALEGNSEDEKIGGGAGGGVFHAGDAGLSLRLFCLIFSAASCARCASREPMMMVSPARAQRRARPMPAGPVPPRMAMGRRGIAHANSGSSISSAVNSSSGSLMLDARVGRVALGGDAAHFQNQRLKIFRAGVLAGGGSGFARNVFFHQRAAVIVGPGMQAELREPAVQLHPRDLNVVDGAGEHEARQSVHLQMLGESRPGARQALMKQQRVLMNEAERDEFGEASGFILEFRAARASGGPSARASRCGRTSWSKWSGCRCGGRCE